MPPPVPPRPPPASNEAAAAKIQASLSFKSKVAIFQKHSGNSKELTKIVQEQTPTSKQPATTANSTLSPAKATAESPTKLALTPAQVSSPFAYIHSNAKPTSPTIASKIAVLERQVDANGHAIELQQVSVAMSPTSKLPPKNQPTISAAACKDSSVCAVDFKATLLMRWAGWSKQQRIGAGIALFAFFLAIILAAALIGKGPETVLSLNERLQIAEVTLQYSSEALGMAPPEEFSSACTAGAFDVSASLLMGNLTVSVGDLDRTLPEARALLEWLQVDLSRGLLFRDLVYRGNDTCFLPAELVAAFATPGQRLAAPLEPLPFHLYSASLSVFGQSVPVFVMLGVADLKFPEEVHLAVVLQPASMVTGAVPSASLLGTSLSTISTWAGALLPDDGSVWVAFASASFAFRSEAFLAAGLSLSADCGDEADFASVPFLANAQPWLDEAAGPASKRGHLRAWAPLSSGGPDFSEAWLEVSALTHRAFPLPNARGMAVGDALRCLLASAGPACSGRARVIRFASNGGFLCYFLELCIWQGWRWGSWRSACSASNPTPLM
jgi:hypothetical protein